MQQYREIKGRHPGTILFFRMGDFYETFFEDAELMSRVLGITLTSRNNGGASEVPLAGVPVKSGPDYVRRLVQLGHRVSICEQVEDPRTARGLVRREVVETVTPGAAFADDLLDGSRNNFLCAIAYDLRGKRDDDGRSAENETVGIAALDVSTGEFRLTTVTEADRAAVLARLAPSEIVVSDDQPVMEGATLVIQRPLWEFDPGMARDELQRHFRVTSLDGFGIEACDDLALGAAGALLRYVRELQPGGVPHLHPPIVERAGGTMPLDGMTRRNLELIESLRGGVGTEGTLIGVLDRTLTPMGARLLRQRILAPLTAVDRIEARLDSVAILVRNQIARASLRDALDGVRDIERLAAKVAAGRISPRELRALGDSIAKLPAVENAVLRLSAGAAEGVREFSGEGARRGQTEELPGSLRDVMARWDACHELGADIRNVLTERPPITLGEDATVRAGFDGELDELRQLRDGGKSAIAQIQSDERERTGIGSLKVGYNRVFGYYIEVTNSNGHRIPDDYQRRQTLTGAERYVTPALKEYEERVLTAAERIETRERDLFENLRGRIAREVARAQCAARALAELDVLATLAEVAECEGYTRPAVSDGFDLVIVAGRHPVVERMMPREKFIPNDVTLVDGAQVIILTGPNMAGKSTVLRQIGLIVLMAQIGSFVPATSADIGVVDRLFTRVGASDNLVRGQSTFMVEMSETSAILHSATQRSLVLLDEIGRGTSTYDGVSIAWAVTEHLHDRIGCKTVFATHYHELTQLADQLVGVRNFNVRVREVGEEVLFLHTLDPGGADRSYGIEVGRLAGLPTSVLKRARTLLRQMEGDHQMGRPESGSQDRSRIPNRREMPSSAGANVGQFGLFGPEFSSEPVPNPVIEMLTSLDTNTMTPLQALARLEQLIADARQQT